MIYDVAITDHVNETASLHLLAHFRRGRIQEDLCFALWSPSTGNNRTTAIVHKVVLPRADERELHGGASFLPAYLTRSLLLARSERCGLALMHSHPTTGWQDMSEPDIVAERDVLAPCANATMLPLVGLTVAADGYWSARFWIKTNEYRRHWCTKVRVIGKDKYSLFYNNELLPATTTKGRIAAHLRHVGCRSPRRYLTPPSRRCRPRQRRFRGDRSSCPHRRAKRYSG